MPIEAQRDAGLTLRGGTDFLRPRVLWPDAPEGGPIAVVLAEHGARLELAEALCRAGCVVLAIRTAQADVATVALEWAADHGRSLGADPERLLLAGGRLAAAAAVRARDEGWPVISHQLLIGPGLADEHAAASLAGVAPAAVVDDPVYAARLRLAGVEVEELSSREPAGGALLGALKDWP